MRTILFACTHNAGRSKMAAAFFNDLADPLKAKAISAGTNPAKAIHPEVRAVMKEVSIDLEAEEPTLLTEDVARKADMLVTMGCGETCPVVPDLTRLDWQLDDPKGKSIEAVRRIRDEIRAQVTALVANNNWKC